MTFDELLAQVVELLRRQGRVSYGALKRRFAIDDAYLQDLKDELIDAQRVAVDEDGKVLVWVGGTAVARDQLPVASPQPPAPSTQILDPIRDAGERRQLTVMFCDLVGSTALSTRLDPEELRAVIRAYRETCATVIRRFDGYLAKYIGDGLLVYFGYPLAHEDDAQRAVRAGLGIVEVIHELPLQNTLLQHPIQVRIGIHTGLVIAGEMGVSDQPEPLAIVGETPNLAARLQQDIAQPDTVVISAATYHLIQGYLECADLGLREVKGVPAPLQVYRVLGESGVHGRLEVAARHGLTPLVGREQEIRLLLGCWEQAKEGQGQVVLLSGEAGIGKSRLVRVLRERIVGETRAWLECRCSPYHQNSALYPIIDLLQRMLGFKRDDAPEEKLRKLERALQSRGGVPPPLQEEVPLFAALLSLPHPDGYPPLNLTPQRQKQKTLETLLTWLLAEAEQQPVAFIVEDPQWADPSTLEFLGLLIEQVPTVRLLTILAFRPEFPPPWTPRSHFIHLTLQRLPHKQVREMVSLVVAQNSRPSTSSGRTELESSGEISSVRAEPVEVRTTLPDDLIDTVVARTDGVPLFVEELTKIVLESESVRAWLRPGSSTGHVLLPQIGIPTTLHDALMARLDRLGSAKEIAQVGATLGREFSYELLHAVSPLDEAALRQGLRQLVEAELLYQRGLPPQATYFFKHALIQDAAYQSLLKSTRQQYHQQIAQVLEERFPEIIETHSELLAHHYTEAGLIPEAITYWRRAGRRASERSAYTEAISHLAKGLELLKTLPDASECVQQELTLQLALGGVLIATKGYAAVEVAKAYARARELCQQVGEAHLFPILSGLFGFYLNRAELQTAHELAERLQHLAQNMQDPALFTGARHQLGIVLYFLGEFTSARKHLEQGLALYDSQEPRASGPLQDPRVSFLCWVAPVLYFLGYPDQAQQRACEALALARELDHPFSLALALSYAAGVHRRRGEPHAAQELGETGIALCREHGFSQMLAEETFYQGWSLVEQGEAEKGIAQMWQCLAAYQATGAELGRLSRLALLAEAYGKVGQVEKGLILLAEALAVVHKTGERYCEAELYRLKGTLTLQKSEVRGPESGVINPQPLTPNPQTEAEACFLKAIEIARRQQAKSLELRAVMSLARLWQGQGKKEEAHRMLAEIYNWFTEGFDTKDLQEAKALLEELSH